MRLTRRSIAVSLAVAAGAVSVALAVVSSSENSEPKERRVMSGPYRDVQLSGTGQEALEFLVDGYTELFVDELAKSSEQEAVAAVGLMDGQEGLEYTPNIALGTENDLERLYAQDPKYGSYYVSNAWEYSTTIEPSLEQPPAAMVDAWGVLRNELEDKVMDPVRWTLARVAYKLNRTELPITLTEDATAFVFEDDGDHVDALEFSTRAEVLSRLRTRGYVARRPGGR